MGTGPKIKARARGLGRGHVYVRDTFERGGRERQGGAGLYACRACDSSARLLPVGAEVGGAGDAPRDASSPLGAWRRDSVLRADVSGRAAACAGAGGAAAEAATGAAAGEGTRDALAQPLISPALGGAAAGTGEAATGDRVGDAGLTACGAAGDASAKTEDAILDSRGVASSRFEAGAAGEEAPPAAGDEAGFSMGLVASKKARGEGRAAGPALDSAGEDRPPPKLPRGDSGALALPASPPASGSGGTLLLEAAGASGDDDDDDATTTSLMEACLDMSIRREEDSVVSRGVAPGAAAAEAAPRRWMVDTLAAPDAAAALAEALGDDPATCAAVDGKKASRFPRWAR